MALPRPTRPGWPEYAAEFLRKDLHKLGVYHEKRRRKDMTVNNKMPSYAHLEESHTNPGAFFATDDGIGDSYGCTHCLFDRDEYVSGDIAPFPCSTHKCTSGVWVDRQQAALLALGINPFEDKEKP